MAYGDIGRRRQFVVSVLSDKGMYPAITFQSKEALFVATPSLVYSAVPLAVDGEWGFTSENAWCNASELRLWGALMFSLEEGQGFFRFHPLSGQLVLAERFNEGLVRAAAEREAARRAPQSHDLRSRAPRHEDIAALYEALLQADNVILRGVSCYLKAFLLWEHHFFREEMGLNLYIAVEAGLSVIRRRLGSVAGRDVSYDEVFEFVTSTFGEGLAEYWEEIHDDRTILVHPDDRFGAEVFHPQMADDIYEFLDPMLSLYRYVLLGIPRPSDDVILGRMQGKLD